MGGLPSIGTATVSLLLVLLPNGLQAVVVFPPFLRERTMDAASSIKVNPTASIVLSVKKGGNTATGCNPFGSKANERATVAVTSVGKPPPPIAPTGIEPTGGAPGGCKKE